MDFFYNNSEPPRMGEKWRKIRSLKLAEREGFEPSVPLWDTHAFQACTLNRSVISPRHERRIRTDFPSLGKENSQQMSGLVFKSCIMARLLLS